MIANLCFLALLFPSAVFAKSGMESSEDKMVRLCNTELTTDYSNPFSYRVLNASGAASVSKEFHRKAKKFLVEADSYDCARVETEGLDTLNYYDKTIRPKFLGYNAALRKAKDFCSQSIGCWSKHIDPCVNASKIALREVIADHFALSAKLNQLRTTCSQRQTFGPPLSAATAEVDDVVR